MGETLKVSEAIQVLGAVKMEFDGEFIAECCNSKITRGNSFYSVMSGGESDEVAYECCTRCLKKQGYYEKHRHDDFDAELYLKDLSETSSI